MAIMCSDHGRWARRKLVPFIIVMMVVAHQTSTVLCVHSVSRANVSSPSSPSTKLFYVNDKLDDEQVSSYMHARRNHSLSTSLSVSPPSPYQRRHPLASSPSKPHQSSRPYSYSPIVKSNISDSNLFLPSSSSTSYLNLVNNRAGGDRASTESTSAKPGEASLKNASEVDLSWVQPVYKPSVTTSTTSTTTTTSTTPPSSSPDGLVLNYQKASEPVMLANRTTSASTRMQTNTSGSNSSNAKTKETTINTPVMTETVVTDTFRDRLGNVSFSLRDEQWVAPIIALSVLNMLVILGFECFVIYRACKTSPSRRHIFLGQMLLLGLFVSSAMGIFFAPRASWLTCSIIRAGVGMSYTLVYATLLVKTIFLLSIHSGVYLPAEYQALLLFFIITTQVAIDGQWLMYESSGTVIDYMDGFGHEVYKCDHSMHHMLGSLSYVMLLIVLIAIMSFRVRGYRDNHGEAMFLGIVSISTIVLWLVWITGTMTSTPHYRDGFVAFGVVGNATLIFMIMFLPKGRQLAAVGREGGHGDDRDQLSTTSSPSIYTPSFLHIKPVSQLIPLAKPLGSMTSGVSNHSAGGFQRSSISNYHLYKQFQGTSTTITSPTSLTGPSHPLPAIPNSYSSHAIFNCPPPVRKVLEEEDDEGNDPNYSNLSNIFTTSAATGQSVLNSPDSEKLSNNSTGKCSSSASSGHKQPSSSSRNSRGSSTTSAHNKIHSKLTANDKNGLFYLQSPPPLPTSGPRDRQLPQTPATSTAAATPALPSTRGWRQQVMAQKGHHFGTSVPNHAHPPSRFYGYTPGTRTTGFGQHNPGLSAKGTSFYPGAAPSSTAAALITTPLGPPPSLLAQHPLLSPVSDTEVASYYFSSFDTATRQQQQLNGRDEQSNHNSLANFRYFRRPHY